MEQDNTMKENERQSSWITYLPHLWDQMILDIFELLRRASQSPPPSQPPLFLQSVHSTNIYTECPSCVCILKAGSKTWEQQELVWISQNKPSLPHQVGGLASGSWILCCKCPQERRLPTGTRSLALPGACNSQLTHSFSLRHKNLPAKMQRFLGRRNKLNHWYRWVKHISTTLQVLKKNA